MGSKGLRLYRICLARGTRQVYSWLTNENKDPSNPLLFFSPDMIICHMSFRNKLYIVRSLWACLVRQLSKLLYIFFLLNKTNILYMYIYYGFFWVFVKVYCSCSYDLWSIKKFFMHQGLELTYWVRVEQCEFGPLCLAISKFLSSDEPRTWSFLYREYQSWLFSWALVQRDTGNLMQYSVNETQNWYISSPSQYLLIPLCLFNFLFCYGLSIDNVNEHLSF